MLSQVKPSEVEVGKVYRVVKTSYKISPEMIHEGCLVKITCKNSRSCHAAPISGPATRREWAYLNTWGNVNEMFEGPIEESDAPQQALDLGSRCPICGTAGQWIAMAIKCPSCWRVW